MDQQYSKETDGRKAQSFSCTPNQRHGTDEPADLGDRGEGERLKVNVCAGTNCYLKGSSQVLREVLQCVETGHLQDKVEVSVSFCFDQCGEGPTVRVGALKLQQCTGPKACAAIREHLQAQAPLE